MTAVSQSNMAAPTPDFSGVEFATSTAGRPVARIGDVVLAIITPASGFALSATGSVAKPEGPDIDRCPRL